MADPKTKPAKPPAAPTPVQATEAAIAAALEHLNAAVAILRPVCTTLTDTERRTSQGKLRVGEATVLREVLGVADAHPALVAGHTDNDGGTDPARFETDLLHTWFGLHDAFAQGADAVDARLNLLSRLLNDSAMFHGARARRPTLRVYNDLAALAGNNAALRDALRNALAYYGDVARKAQRTVRAKKKA